MGSTRSSDKAWHRVRDGALWFTALAPLWWAWATPGPPQRPRRTALSPAPVDASLPPCVDCNVILVSIDTLRADHLGAYGYPQPTSPSLDGLAERGMLFERAYSGSFVTADAHMSIFTSLPPSVHGVKNAVPAERFAHRLSDEIPTLPEWLREAGLATAAFTSGGNVSAAYGFDRGFDSYAVHSDTEVGVARTLKFAAQQHRAGRRFFAFLHTYEAHDPYLPPADVAKLFYRNYMGQVPQSREELLAREPNVTFKMQRAAYWATVDKDSEADVQQLIAAYDAEIRSIDEALQVLWQALPNFGRTLVVVTSDHGEQFGEHGGFLHNDVYDELLRVPLLVIHPDGPRGVRVAQPVSTMDIAPTLLEILKLPSRGGLMGRSFARPDALPARPVLAEKKGGPKALIDADYKLIRRPSAHKPELYNLAVDPSEQRDRAREHPELARRLGKQLDSLDRASRSLRAATAPGAQAWALDPNLAGQLRALGYGE